MLNELATQIHENARENGFWHDDRNNAECLCLMHSELSEALEELRKGLEPNFLYFTNTGALVNSVNGLPEIQIMDKPEGVPAELADCIIRILDFCGAHEIDIDTAIATKMAYNRTRPAMHGKKF